MVYHVKNSNRTKSAGIDPIIFLSKCLTPAEFRYWPTELEMIGVVWAVRKMHHMIRALQDITTIWTNNSAIANIAKQIKLSLSNDDKLYLRLIRARAYFLQFNISIKHKSGQDYVIPNALSRLSIVCDPPRRTEAQTYANISVELSEEFRAKLIKAYKKREWALIWTELSNAKARNNSTIIAKWRETKTSIDKTLRNLAKRHQNVIL